jgi:hypothetical protein
MTSARLPGLGLAASGSEMDGFDLRLRITAQDRACGVESRIWQPLSLHDRAQIIEGAAESH